MNEQQIDELLLTEELDSIDLEDEMSDRIVYLSEDEALRFGEMY